MATIRAQAVSGVEPKWVMMAPVIGVRRVLEKAGWHRDEVDLYELNEAFSVQALGVTRELGIPLEKVNVNGGAVALGHPIGASGARVLVTLVHELIRRGMQTRRRRTLPSGEATQSRWRWSGHDRRNVQRFAGKAIAYAQYRERYAPEILLPRLHAWCGLTPDWTVADVGAGTGMLSDVFLANGNHVFAVEPNDDMRQMCADLHRDFRIWK